MGTTTSALNRFGDARVSMVGLCRFMSRNFQKSVRSSTDTAYVRILLVCFYIIYYSNVHSKWLDIANQNTAYLQIIYSILLCSLKYVNTQSVHLN